MAMFRLCALLLLSAFWAEAQPANLLILHKGGSSLGFYTAEGKHVASVPVGTHPHEMVISTDRRYLYCTDNGTMLIEQKAEGGNTLSIVDLHRRAKVGEISLGRYRRPHGIDLDRQSGLIYVSCELPDQLLVISPKVGRVVKTYDTKGRTAHMVKLGPRSRYAYVSNSTSDTVAAIELASGAVKLIPTGKRPEGSALAPDGGMLYVVNREAAQIVIIDTATNELAGTIKTGKGPVRVAVTPDSRQVVYGLMHDNAVGIADAVKRVEIATVPLPGSPVSLSLSEDGKFALASAQDLDTTYIVSLGDRKIVREVKTAEGMKPDPAILLP
jgi:YVTN family beta-propeller protein